MACTKNSGITVFRRQHDTARVTRGYETTDCSVLHTLRQIYVVSATTSVPATKTPSHIHREPHLVEPTSFRIYSPAPYNDSHSPIPCIRAHSPALYAYSHLSAPCVKIYSPAPYTFINSSLRMKILPFPYRTRHRREALGSISTNG